jgi:hypothetical protein
MFASLLLACDYYNMPIVRKSKYTTFNMQEIATSNQKQNTKHKP